MDIRSSDAEDAFFTKTRVYQNETVFKNETPTTQKVSKLHSFSLHVLARILLVIC
jgi:hypothetical protein